MIIKNQMGMHHEFSLFGAQFRVLLPREKTECTEVLQEIFPPGGEAPLNTHDDMEQLYLILEGQGFVVVGDEQGNVCVGDLVFIPRGMTHAIKNTGIGNLVYLCFDLFPDGYPDEEQTWDAHERVIYEKFGRAS